LRFDARRFLDARVYFDLAVDKRANSFMADAAHAAMSLSKIMA
jgi:hypothetical protein